MTAHAGRSSRGLDPTRGDGIAGGDRPIGLSPVVHAAQRIAARQGASLEDAIRRSEDLHGRLWAEATGAAEKDPRSIPVGLFIQALNDVIDLHAKRLTASVAVAALAAGLSKKRARAIA